VRLLKQSKQEELAAAKAAKGNPDEVCDEATAISTAIMSKMNKKT